MISAAQSVEWGIKIKKTTGICFLTLGQRREVRGGGDGALDAEVAQDAADQAAREREHLAFGRRVTGEGRPKEWRGSMRIPPPPFGGDGFDEGTGTYRVDVES